MKNENYRIVRYNRHEYRTEYLQSEEWKAKSDFILQRDPICKICDQEKSVDAHHLTYENLPFENLDKDLIGTCRTCHNRIHKHKELSRIKNFRRLKKLFHKSKEQVLLNESFLNEIFNVGAYKHQQIRIVAGIFKISVNNIKEFLNIKTK